MHSWTSIEWHSIYRAVCILSLVIVTIVDLNSQNFAKVDTMSKYMLFQKIIRWNHRVPFKFKDKNEDTKKENQKWWQKKIRTTKISAARALLILRDTRHYTFIVSLKMECTHFNWKLMSFFYVEVGLFGLAIWNLFDDLKAIHIEMDQKRSIFIWPKSFISNLIQNANRFNAYELAVVCLGVDRFSWVKCFWML